MLPLKAEVVLGLLLAVRHRSVRLVLGFGVLIVALTASRGAGGGGGAEAAVLLVGGAVAVVAASRALARGAALEAARRSGGVWWLAPLGRLGGVLLIGIPTVLGAAVVLAPGARAAGHTVAAGVLYAAAVAAPVMALAPLVGASGAAACGFLAVVMGSVPPSAVAASLAGWPAVAAPVVTLWNVLPLEWRAARWLRAGGVHDPVVLAVWMVAGVLLAAWCVARAYRDDTAPSAGG